MQNAKEPHTIQPFYVLEVDYDNVQMAEFVKEKLRVKFENGKAFYEFTQMEEDLLYYKDVVVMPKVHCNTIKHAGYVIHAWWLIIFVLSCPAVT